MDPKAQIRFLETKLPGFLQIETSFLNGGADDRSSRFGDTKGCRQPFPMDCRMAVDESLTIAENRARWLIDTYG
ncbi:hypothetical protein PanWU01x14_360690 [Parasponia andersonii]|uniref:Uncharacterized protein n=1 Tax=Parasponia andersonii TaxID=3476 RepID=A0A2P5A7L6_PARAD|nr:hypothetical protein PanWU01x14_360690 [Parasponia andersonii]